MRDLYRGESPHVGGGELVRVPPPDPLAGYLDRAQRELEWLLEQYQQVKPVAP